MEFINKKFIVQLDYQHEYPAPVIIFQWFCDKTDAYQMIEIPLTDERKTLDGYVLQEDEVKNIADYLTAFVRRNDQNNPI